MDLHYSVYRKSMFVVDIGGSSPNPLSTIPLYCNVVYCTYDFFFIDVMVVSVFFGNYKNVSYNYHTFYVAFSYDTYMYVSDDTYKYLYVSDKLLA